MEILQPPIERGEYYSVKETSERLGLSTKTVRNYIENKKLDAVWWEQGKGLSMWLIPRKSVEAIIESRVSTVPTIPSALADELKALRRDNEATNARLAAIEQSQQRIETALKDRDTLLLQAIRERQNESKEKSWLARLLGL